MKDHSGDPRAATENAVDDLALIDGRRPTDVGNARRLAEAVTDRVRFVETWGKFLVYEAGRWVEDTSGSRMIELAQAVPETLLARALTANSTFERDRAIEHAQRSESRRRMEDMISIARSDKRLRIHHDDLDRDPWLLNVLNGTIDLRSGRLRRHNPMDLLTKQAPVRYDPDARSITLRPASTCGIAVPR